MFDRAAETMPRADLAALQLKRLQADHRARLRQGAACPRASSTPPALRPSHFKTLADIARFPFTMKTDLRDNYPFGLFAVPREQVLRLHASSGPPASRPSSAIRGRDLDLWSDLMARSLACMGAKPGDIFHNAYGYGLFTGGLGFHYGAERLGCTTVPVSGGATERQVLLIRDFGAQRPRRHARPTRSTSPRSPTAWASICASSRCVTAASAPSLGARPFAARSRRSSASRPWTPMACRRSSDRAWPANATRRRAACTSGRIISSAS